MRDEKIGREAMTVFALACVARAMLPVLGIARTARTEWGGGERITALGQNANNSAMILGAGLIALLALQYRLKRARVRHRWLVWPGVGLLRASVVDTGTRGGVVALGPGRRVFAQRPAPFAW